MEFMSEHKMNQIQNTLDSSKNQIPHQQAACRQGIFIHDDAEMIKVPSLLVVTHENLEKKKKFYERIWSM